MLYIVSPALKWQQILTIVPKGTKFWIFEIHFVTYPCLLFLNCHLQILTWLVLTKRITVNHSIAFQLKTCIKNSTEMLWSKVNHLQIRLSSPWSTLPHPLISSLMGVFWKCFKNNYFWLSPFLSLCNCRQITIISLKFGRKHRWNFDIYVAPKLEGNSEISHF